ncbi:MAG: hypothetical protein V1793_12525 [Pseudomonadota bacterium]
MITKSVITTIIIILNAAGICFTLIYLLMRVIKERSSIKKTSFKKSSTPGNPGGRNVDKTSRATREEDIFKDVDLKEFDDLSLDDLK